MQRTLTTKTFRTSETVSTDGAQESKPVSLGYEAFLAERILEAVRPVPSRKSSERTESRREPYHLD